MTRLIDADALMLDIVEAGQANKGGRYKVGDFWELNGAEIRSVVDAQPTAEPVKRGMWTFIRLTDKEYGHKAKECSSCGSTFFDTKQWNYCPNCGAKMRGEHEKAD